LKYIGFDLDIEVAYKYIDIFENSDYFRNKVKDENYVEISKRFLNDSLLTTMCLYFEPFVIALASINMTSLFLNKELPCIDQEEDQKWYMMFDSNLKYEYLNEAVDVLK